MPAAWVCAVLIEMLVRRWHRLRQRPHPPLHPLWAPSLDATDPTAAALLATHARLTHILDDSILPFWLPGCLDHEHGGYRINHDPAGRWRGPGPKYAVPHARTCWFFSRLYRTRPQAEVLAAARLGYRFLRDRLWDREAGGFFWGLSEDGSRPLDDAKHLVAQTFGLYAVAEFALASGDEAAKAFMVEVAGTLEDRFHDRENGGYQSGFTRWWEALPVPVVRTKTLNFHMHVLEALTAASRVTDANHFGERLRELIQIHTSTVVRKHYGACTDLHDERWLPLLDAGRGEVSYGHDLEAIWLVTDGCRAAGLPVALIGDWIQTLGELTLKWGWDRKRGGVYFLGPLDGPAYDRRKVWWVQAESLVGALLIYRLTGDTRFADLYLSTLAWIENRHLDRQGREWHAIIAPDGRITGDKADLWKTPYHNGRAMLMCLDLLRPDGIRLCPEAVTPASAPAS